MYYANFVPNGDALQIFPELKDLGGYNDDGISFKIKSIDKPKIDLTVQELNQYNRRRFVYTRAKYNPISIHIFDTVDDAALGVWIKYFRYYYGDSRPKPQNVYDDSVIGTFNDSSGWGLRPVSEQINFFKRVELYAMFGGKYTQINYINPRIASMDWQNYDSEANGSAELTMTLDYEVVEYAATGKQLSDTPGLIEQFGFGADVTIEPANTVPALTPYSRTSLLNMLNENPAPTNFNGTAFVADPLFGVTNDTSASLFGSGSDFNSITQNLANLSSIPAQSGVGPMIGSVIGSPGVSPGIISALSGRMPVSSSILGNYGVPSFGDVSSDSVNVFTPLSPLEQLSSTAISLPTGNDLSSPTSAITDISNISNYPALPTDMSPPAGPADYVAPPADNSAAPVDSVFGGDFG